MNNKDKIQKFIFEDAPVRGELVHLDETFQTILQQHQYPPLIRQLLGETLVVASLLSGSIKFKGRVTIQFQGKGKLQLLFAQCSHENHLRGLAQWQEEMPESEILDSLKEGVLAIMMDPIDGGHRYQGIVEWRGNSVAESIEAYFEKSEQVPTRVWLAVNEYKASGLLIQVMPRESDKISRLVEDDGWERISYLSATLTPEELLSLDNETLLRRLYGQEDVRIFDPQKIEFRCTCSVPRSENAIRMLGIEDAEEELKDKQQIVVICEFCNKEFTFDRVDVARIFNRGNKPDTSTQIH